MASPIIVKLLISIDLQLSNEERREVIYGSNETGNYEFFMTQE